VYLVFYDNLKAACKAKGISPSALALSLGMSKANVTKWKQGQLPSTGTLQRISEGLDVTTDFLLYGETKKEPAEQADGQNGLDVGFVNDFLSLSDNQKKMVSALVKELSEKG